MAFEIITGSYSNGNDVIDAIAKVWSFDSHDKQSTYHSVSWGDTEIVAIASGLGMRHNGALLSGGLNIYNSGNYKIYKTAKAFICDVGGVGIVGATTAKNVDDSSDILKLSVIYTDSNGNTTVAGGTGNTILPKDVSSSTSAVQVIPYLHVYGGYAADNLYQVYKASSGSINSRYLIGDELYYIFKNLAIKEE